MPECGLEVVQRASSTTCWIPRRSKDGEDIPDSIGRRCIVVVMAVVVVVVVVAIVLGAASPICYLLDSPFSATSVSILHAVADAVAPVQRQ